MKVTIFCLVSAILSSNAFGLEPPKVAGASPSFWALNVSPSNQKTISVTFDQPMRAGFSSWLGRSSLAPDSHSPATLSEDRRTFSLALSFQPGKVYVLALNEKNIPGVGFQNEKGMTLPAHFLVFQTAGPLTPDDTPPQVVRSVPSNGDQEVDPARTKAIVLTFDRPMQTGKQGLHLFENNNAINLSKARFGYSADGQTFTLYHDFKASTPYRVVLNSVTNIGFASAKRVPLWPVQIAFATVQPR